MSYDGDRTAAKTGTSSLMKIAIVIGCLFGVLCLACCGGFYYVGRNLANSVTKDPLKVQSIADSIFEFTIPEGMKPAQGMDLTVAGKGARTAIYSATDGRGLFLMEITAPFDPSQVRSGQFDQQAGKPKVRIEKKTIHKVSIHQQTCDFEVGNGQDDNGREITMAGGVFPSKTGQMAFLILTGPADQLTEEAALSFVNSLGEPVAAESAAESDNPPAAASSEPGAASPEAAPAEAVSTPK